jgi:predicted DNA-binding transcriptional regulator AlpA
VSPPGPSHHCLEECAMENADDLLTTAEVALIMRSPVSTLRYWRHLGTGPHSFRVGRRVVYRRADVSAWLHEQAEAGRTDRAG